jgi:hypothetical protein
MTMSDSVSSEDSIFDNHMHGMSRTQLQSNN